MVSWVAKKMQLASGSPDASVLQAPPSLISWLRKYITKRNFEVGDSKNGLFNKINPMGQGAKVCQYKMLVSGEKNLYILPLTNCQYAQQFPESAWVEICTSVRNSSGDHLHHICT